MTHSLHHIYNLYTDVLQCTACIYILLDETKKCFVLSDMVICKLILPCCFFLKSHLGQTKVLKLTNINKFKFSIIIY